MIRIAIQMITGDRFKYLALVAGVAFAALLITQQGSIFNGYANRTTAWLRDTAPADLWVMDEQVQMDNDPKAMSDTTLNRVRGVAGVEWAVPMYKDYLQARLPDATLETVRVIGLDDATLIGGPRVVTGSMAALRQQGGVLVHADAGASPVLRDAAGNGLAVGDRFSINDNEVRVVGTYEATPEFFWEPVVYTTYTRALQIAPRERKQLTYVLAKVRPDADLKDVQSAINAVPGIKALTNAEFQQLTRDYVLSQTGILINFGITIALGFVIGLLASGQTFYTFVLENLRHFAALKAMGASNLVLLRMMFVQVTFVSLLGFGVGVGVATLTGFAFRSASLAFEMTWHIPVFGLAGVLGCCLAAGGLSLIRVMRLEPAVVFK